MKKNCYDNWLMLKKLWATKTFLSMRLTFYVLLLATIQSLATDSYAQATKLNLTMKNTTVREVLSEIEDMSEFYFLYNSKIINVDREVSVNFKNKKINEALDLLFKDTGVSYNIVDRQIVLSGMAPSKTYSVSAQQKTVVGTVTDNTGQPLPGVTVVVKGTTQGTVTNADGEYTISSLPEDATLVFSFVGMQTQEVVVGKQSKINITMEVDAIGIEEVVAIGYGTVKKRDLTSAIAQINAEDIENRVTSRLEEAMQGKMSGVSIQNSSGLPGSAPVIRIRGTNSITEGNQPLFVVDGMPIEDAVAIANINMNDVANVEVLKDAASAAIYGSRGSNGVIIITTKLGEMGTPKITYDMYYGVQTPEKTLDILTGSELGQILVERRTWELNQDIRYDENTPNDDRPKNMRIDPNWVTGNVSTYDPQDIMFREAPIQNHNLSISGGTKRTKYFASLNYLNQEGIVPNTSFEKFALRVNLETKIKDFITLGLNISPSYSTQLDNNSEAKDQTLSGMLLAPSVANPLDYHYDETKKVMINDYYDYYGFSGSIAPVAYRLFNMRQEYIRSQLLSSAFLDFKIIDGLNFRSSVYLRQYGNKFNDYRDIYVGSGKRYSEVRNDFQTNWTLENTLTYVKDFGKHAITALVGYSTQKDFFESTRVRGQGFSNDIALTLGNATDINSWGQSVQEWSLVSSFARVTYSYDSRYMLTASIRGDGSSRFGGNNKWGYFPAFSGAWRISEEEFMESINQTVSTLKVRSSYGATGNNRIGNYRSLATLVSSSPLLGTNEDRQAGLNPGGFSNNDLTWEKNNSIDIGLDIGLFSNRVNLSVDWYKQTTKDLLLDVPVPYVTGFSNAIQNIGKVSNKGFELELSTTNIATSDFRWNTKFNFSNNKNEVLELGTDGAPMITGEWYARVSYTGIGYPIGSFYMWETDGIFMNQAEVDGAAHFKDEGVGDVKFVDQNGDGVVDADDRVILGQPMPKYNLGITNTFQYKGFDLNVFLNGAGGHKTYFIQSRYISRLGSTFLGEWRNRYIDAQNPGDGKTPKVTSNTGTNGADEEQDRWLYDSDWWRIKNVTLGYNFSSAFLQKFKISNLRVYVSGDNLYLNTKYPGYNPEGVISPGTGRGTSQDEPSANTSNGYDFGSMPLARRYTVGLNITF